MLLAFVWLFGCADAGEALSTDERAGSVETVPPFATGAMAVFAKIAPKNHWLRTFREPTRIGVKEAFESVEALNSNNLSYQRNPRGASVLCGFGQVQWSQSSSGARDCSLSHGSMNRHQPAKYTMVFARLKTVFARDAADAFGAGIPAD